MQHKKCCKCGKSKNFSDFQRRKRNSDGLTTRCKSCIKEDKIDYIKRNQHRTWSQQTLSGHRLNGNIINITIEELTTHAKKIQFCVMCGKKLDWSITGRVSSHHDSPSLDRTNNENTVNMDSIEIICHECNTTKGRRTKDEFIDYCRRVALLKKSGESFYD